MVNFFYLILKQARLLFMFCLDKKKNKEERNEKKLKKNRIETIYFLEFEWVEIRNKINFIYFFEWVEKSV